MLLANYINIIAAKAFRTWALFFVLLDLLTLRLLFANIRSVADSLVPSDPTTTS